jgi:hypothetical protein
VYRRSDFGLTYEEDEPPLNIMSSDLAARLDQQFAITPHNVFVIADTLTLTFDERGRFVSLDAYTNDARWFKQSETKRSGARGALVLLDRPEDRLSLDVVPVYRFDALALILSIGLGGPASEYFEVGDDLFVGLDDRRIAEIVLTNLLVE